MTNDDCNVYVTPCVMLFVDSMAKGNHAAFLPIYRYLFSEYDTEFQQAIHHKGMELFGKGDARFMDAIYKVRAYPLMPYHMGPLSCKHTE